MKKNPDIPWKENPKIASISMSNSSDKSEGRSSADKKGTDNDSSYKITK